MDEDRFIEYYILKVGTDSVSELDFKKTFEFLNENYNSQLILNNIEKYNIINVTFKILKL